MLALGLSACGSQQETATTPSAAATPAEPAGATEPANTSTTGSTLALSFDGVPEPVKEAPLSIAPKGGFVLGMETAKAYVTVLGGPKAPLAVGTYAIRDTAGSVVSATSSLPARFAKEEEATQGGYLTTLGMKAGSPIAGLVDLGKGPEELHGRQLGQISFTRVADGSADGSFEFTVYGMTGTSEVTYQGRQRPLHTLKGHQVKGSFKNVPFGDPGKAVEDLQEALKALPQ